LENSYSDIERTYAQDSFLGFELALIVTETDIHEKPTMEVFYRAGNLDLLVGPKPSKLRLDIEEALKSAESEDSLEAKAEKFSESLIGFFKEAKVDQINDLVSTLWNILIQKAIAPDYDDDQKLIASTFQTIRNKHGASDLNLDVS
jgi:hypothetical protein